MHIFFCFIPAIVVLVLALLISAFGILKWDQEAMFVGVMFLEYMLPVTILGGVIAAIIVCFA